MRDLAGRRRRDRELPSPAGDPAGGCRQAPEGVFSAAWAAKRAFASSIFLP
ncbi:hypothetical protein SAMN05428944_5113 [Streptomyces sp. 1222.5]|nr:hypothetical protein BX260_2984 [Streptomyces sp. 5112.2]SEC79348.1 hypothetical protein SAMN05428944_5113 [Streptomyces sp. 1222.5]SED00255.1 hypothetical protein SAMN05216532_3082 [Streptomyces sp. 2231.1]